MRYRAEIDGLRAVAVVPVVLFHAGFGLVGGGFVGVDVFFVISGYLITSIILAELAAGDFSLLRFYERRARRILPALFFVMAACVPFAWLLFAPQDMEDFSESLIAVATFSSNFLFWSESGYFDTATELKPLIHTWSLAVEEQYYILFPLLLMLLWKAPRRWLLPVLGVLALASLAGAHWGAYAFPSATFFLLPTRAWELLIGSFAALYLRDSPAAPGNQVLGLLGLAMIAAAVFAFDRSTPFPSLYALLPAGGTFLVIVFAGGGTLAGRLLGSRPLVALGLISYSVYLWHQPLLAFYRHWSLAEPSTAAKIALCLAAFCLGYLSWRLVERPFRNRRFLSRHAVAGLASLACAGFISAGVFGDLHKPSMELAVGLERIVIPAKFGGIEVDGADCSFPNLPDEFCRIAGTRKAAPPLSLFVIGDSHARAFTEAVDRNRSLYTEFFDLSASGCPFLLGLSVYIGSDPHRCTAAYQAKRLDFLAARGGHRKVVIVTARWPLYLYGSGFDNGIGGVERRDRIVAASSLSVDEAQRRRAFFVSLETTLTAILERADHLVFVLPTHTNGWNVPDKARRVGWGVDSLSELEQGLAIPSAAVTRRVSEINSFVGRFQESHPAMTVVDPRRFTCSDTAGRCYGFKNGEFMFTDADHLAFSVNQRILMEIAALLEKGDWQARR